MNISTPYILLYDGDCGLCHGSVQFLYKRDRKHRFTFVPLHSPLGTQLTNQSGIDTKRIDSIVLIEQNVAYFIKSRAVLKSLNALGGLWKLVYPLLMLPTCFGDWTYDFIAKHRLKWFKKPQCAIPDKVDKKYFRES
jgi:predicted DCC family thiol-disulfide oxidoreductase YuxK